jgi:hypothetical protein
MKKDRIRMRAGHRGNPVAKHAHEVNRSLIYRDHTAYTRKVKHKARSLTP